VRRVAVLVALAACGDNRAGIPLDAPLAIDRDGEADGSVFGQLFGEPCTQVPAPEVGLCRDGQGACHDEPGGAVCRPFCSIAGAPQCEPRGGTAELTDRGACVCVP
jgi:hypothetical protein